MFTVKLPIKAYLKKYLQRKCNVSGDNLIVSTNDQIGFGLYIVESLQKKREFYLNHNQEEVNKFVTSLSDSITLQIGCNVANCSGMFIHPEKVYFINSFAEKAFRNEMFAVINGNTMYNPNLIIKNIIYDFCGIYDITEDDLQIDTIYKTYQRHKERYSYIK